MNCCTSISLPQSATLGEAILQAKRRMAESRSLEASEARDARYWLDAVAGTLHAGPELLQAERLEHVLLFNLLGDPLLKLRRPHVLRLEAAPAVAAGQRLVVSGETAVAGYLTVELVCRRDRTRIPAPRRQSPPATDTELAAFDEVYEQANDGRWTAKSFFCSAGPFQAALEVPSEARGPCYVVAFVDGAGDCELGSTPVAIRASDCARDVRARGRGAGRPASH